MAWLVENGAVDEKSQWAQWGASTAAETMELGALVRRRADAREAVCLVLAVEQNGELFVHDPERCFCRVSRDECDVLANATEESRGEARGCLALALVMHRLTLE